MYKKSITDESIIKRIDRGVHISLIVIGLFVAIITISLLYNIYNENISLGKFPLLISILLINSIYLITLGILGLIKKSDDLYILNVIFAVINLVLLFVY